MSFKEIWEKMKVSMEEEKVEKPKDFSFNRNRKVMATVLMPTIEEIKKEEVGLDEPLEDKSQNNEVENRKN
jgi:hypothetical protein